MTDILSANDLLVLGPAAVGDAQGGAGVIDPAIKPIDVTMRLAGRVFPVKCARGDNLAVHLALTKAQPGDVLLIDAGGVMDVAVMGDLMALAAQVRGIAGVVVDGCVRDAHEITALGLPVFARGLCVKAPERKTMGETGVSVSCGGQVASPGDMVVGGRDGVVLIKPEYFAKLAALAKTQPVKEAQLSQRIKQGDTTIDIFGLAAIIPVQN